MWSQADAELGDSASVWHAVVSKSVYCSACSRPHSRYVYSQISSRSRSAAGDSRYSAMSAAKPTLKRICVEPGEEKKILIDAAVVGEAMAKASEFKSRFAGMRYRPDSH